MDEPVFADDELMAYADGELPGARAGELASTLASDAALADRLALFTQTRAREQEEFAPMLDSAVPEHLIQKVRGLAEKTAPGAVPDNIVAMAAKPVPEKTGRWPVWPVSLAASIALAVGLGAGLLLNGGGSGLMVAAPK